MAKKYPLYWNFPKGEPAPIMYRLSAKGWKLTKEARIGLKKLGEY